MSGLKASRNPRSAGARIAQRSVSQMLYVTIEMRSGCISFLSSVISGFRSGWWRIAERAALQDRILAADRIYFRSLVGLREPVHCIGIDDFTQRCLAFSNDGCRS